MSFRDSDIILFFLPKNKGKKALKRPWLWIEYEYNFFSPRVSLERFFGTLLGY